MFNDVGHAWTVATQGTKPFLWSNRILGCGKLEEVLNGVQAVVPELQAIPGNPPGVNQREVWGENREVVIQQPGVDKRNIIVAGVMT